MAEVRTDPVKAVFLSREEFWDENYSARVPGSLLRNSLSDPDDNPSEGERWYYACPCGCGAAGAVVVGEKNKPTRSPSWMWNGSTDAPTLTPSVHHVGHWHGWLTDGVWSSC